MKKEFKEVFKNKNERILISNFEDIIANAVVINFNEDFIEIPGMVLFKKEGESSLLQKILNPGLEFIDIKEEDFKKMISLIDTISVEKDRIVNKSKLKPARDTMFNLTALIKNTVFVKITEDSIFVNDFIFTNNEAEFHGDGMFTSRKVYFLGLEDLSKMREALSLNS